MDYVEERRSAFRPVSPELWRFLAGFVSPRSLPGLIKTIEEDDQLERQAAILAIAQSDFTEGQDYLSAKGYQLEEPISWHEIGEQYAARS
jgi:hypothetical protein